MKRNKITAGILAIIFGGLGIHKFYLGEPLWGVLYLLFCVTGIPALIGLIEGIAYIVMSQDEFDRNFNKE